MTHDSEPKRPLGLPTLDVGAARALLLQRCPTLDDAERLPLAASLGRILAADVVADLDQPAFDRAMMDGIAVRSDDCRPGAPALLFAGVGRAGAPFPGLLPIGGYVRVMTGGVVPAGADAMVPFEDVATEPPEDDNPTAPRRATTAVRFGQHIVRQGQEVRAGDVVVARGASLDAARLGVLAAFGAGEVPCIRRPIVGLMPTGDELVAVGQRPGLGQVRDSNRWMLAAMLEQWGAQVVHAHAAADHRADLQAGLEALAERCDALVLSGGVSMGDYDLVGAALRALGAEVLLHRVRMRPGKPILIAELPATRGRPPRLVLALPGNPVSSFVAGQLFVRPALRRLAGATAGAWVKLRAPLATAVPANGDREAYLAATWRADAHGDAAIAVVATHGSADLAHFAQSELLLCRPAHAAAASIGELATALVWSDR